ncbi:MAG: transcription termination/antitermination NusG family protein [Planctomycetota bacterium]
MPILKREPDIFPEDLFQQPQLLEKEWWALYTISRQEKKLMRLLVAAELAFYAPVIERRHRSPNGRLRKTFEPLFANYVFLCGDEDARHRALCTGCVSRNTLVESPEELIQDLRQIQGLIKSEAPLSPESRLEPGQRVRIRNGPFSGYEGIITRREHDVRLNVFVRFMTQGVSVSIDDCQADQI